VGRSFALLFSDDGLLPHEKIVANRQVSLISVFDWVKDPAQFNLLYYGGLAVFVAFTLGLLSRITNLLSLLLVISVIHRKQFLSLPVEDILPIMLFYLCLAPTGAYWSLDALIFRKNKPPAPGYAANIATRLMQIHLAGIYVMMTIAKVRIDLWTSGTAMWWLNAKADGRLVDFTGLHELLINAWTLLHFVFEATFVVLIWGQATRPLVLALSLLLWLGFALATGQVLFALGMLAFGAVFVSPEWLRGCCGAAGNSANSAARARPS